MSNKKTDEPLVDARGISLKSDYDKMPSEPHVMYCTMTAVFTAIGLGIAFGTYTFGNTAAYNSKIETLRVLELGWVYLGVIVIKLCFVGVSITAASARKGAKVNVPDQHCYKVYTPPGQPELGYVTLETEGPLGAFNRAQRSVANYWEVAPFFFLNFICGGFVFPFPAFVSAVVFGVARMLYAIGYTSGKESRLSGFMLGNLANQVCEGFVLFAGLKSTGFLG